DIISVNWSPDGSKIVYIDRNDLISVINSGSFELEKQFQASDEVNDIVWNSDMTVLLASLGNGKIRAYKYPDFDISHSMVGHTDACIQLRYNRNFTKFYVGSVDSFISVWDSKSMHCIKCLNSYEYSIRNFDTSFDEFFLAAATENPGLTVVNIENDEKVHHYNTKNYVTALSWHPKKAILAFSVHRANEPSEPVIRLYGSFQ
ncbi:MAG: hypothetical protein MHPSP_001872, partial [Paramarteilia canceri]